MVITFSHSIVIICLFLIRVWISHKGQRVGFIYFYITRIWHGSWQIMVIIKWLNSYLNSYPSNPSFLHYTVFLVTVLSSPAFCISCSLGQEYSTSPFCHLANTYPYKEFSLLFLFIIWLIHTHISGLSFSAQVGCHSKQHSPTGLGTFLMCFHKSSKYVYHKPFYLCLCAHNLVYTW